MTKDHKIFRLQKALGESFKDFDERVEALLDTLMEDREREIVSVNVHSIYATVVVRSPKSN